MLILLVESKRKREGVYMPRFQRIYVDILDNYGVK